MIVVDASLVIEVITGSDRGLAAFQKMEDGQLVLVAPDILGLEVLQVMRRLVRQDHLSLAEAEHSLRVFDKTRIRFYAHSLVMSRVWDLRHNMTAYDASYVALAEILDAELWTSDRKLSGIPGTKARVVVY